MRYDMAKFPERLRQARERKEMTQKKLAKTAGVSSHTYISNYETGKHMPNSFVLIMLAETLDVSLNWLCGEKERQDKK